MNVELARRAVACENWRWMPGMKAVAVRDGDLESVVQRVPDDLRLWRTYSDQTLPDLTDPATLGCLLALVREARQDPSWQPYVAFYGGDAIWWLEQPSQFRQTSHESYASVLVAALEAAP